MRRRALGKTGLEVSELMLGTWGLSGDGYGPVTEAEQDRVVARALALGVDAFETADCYAHGAMEERLGRRVPKQGRALIVTKIGTDREAEPPRKRFDASFLTERLAASRARQGRDVLDVVLLHNPSQKALERGAATEWLAGRKRAGELKAWGVSAGDVATARAAIAAGAEVLELAFNAFHRADLAAIALELEQSGAGLIARSVLAHGLLTGHWSAERSFPEGDHRAERWLGEDLRRRVRQLDALRPAVGGAVLSLRAVALRYVLAQPRVSGAAIGPRSILQLDQLVREAGSEPPYLSEATLNALDARLTELGVAS
jgi:aryl-alcohol dehydrogenase-like predicted oxidoreductase